MRVSIVMVMSADGRITQGDQPGTAHWASAEDQVVFKDLMSSHDCVIMGSSTYDAARSIITPNPLKPRIILTANPKRYADSSVPGLEFSADSPRDILDSLVARNFQNIMIVGGAETNARFLDAGCVDELYITVEPQVFGSGLPLTKELSTGYALQLLNLSQLNKQGTLMLHYRVLKHDKDA